MQNIERPLTERYERNGWPSLARPDIEPPSGWSLSLITAVNRVHNHNLSPDGQQIAFIWDTEELSDIYTMPSAGGWPARVTTDRPAYQYWMDEVPQWSPDSSWLAFCIKGHVHVAPLLGGIPKNVSDFTHRAFSPIWMPDSFGLIISVERYQASKLVLTDRLGSWPQALTGGGGDDVDAHPSPDGRLVAYVHYPPADLKRREIRIVEVSSGLIRCLTSTSGEIDWSPRWSPDGKQIAFLSQRSGFMDVWLANPESGEINPLTHAHHDIDDIAWSPDGKFLTGTLNNEGRLELVLIRSKDGEITPLRSESGCYFRPNWSPDGAFITVEYTTPTEPPAIFRLEVNQTDPRKPVPQENVTQLTFSTPPALARLPQVLPEHVHFYSHDGVRVPALLYRPLQSNGAAIVHPHGGPRDQWLYEWDVFRQYMVAKGYTYLAVDYRGSSGYGADYEKLNEGNWGIGDSEDCLFGARYLAELDGIDPTCIAIMGVSYGGYLVTCALARDPDYLFACGVILYGDSNLFTTWAQCERGVRLEQEMMMGHPSRAYRAYMEGSPINQVDNIRRPMLILHGLRDEVVSPQSAEELVEALRKGNKVFEYRTYADESHGFLRRENITDVYTRVERFLDWYLLPPPLTKSPEGL